MFGCRKDEGREGLAGAEGTPLHIHRPDRPMPLRVQRRGTLPATAHAGQVPAVSGPGRHQQRPAAEVVAEVAQDRHRHAGKPVDAVLR